MKNPNLIKY